MKASEYLEKKFGRLTLGRSLRAERMCQEMTQGQLAKKVGVSVQAISGFENSKDFPSYTTLKKIAKVFKMDEELYVHLLLEDLMHKKGIEGYTITVKRTA